MLLSLFSSLTHAGRQPQTESFLFPSKMKLKLHDLIYLACLYGQTGIVEDIIQHQQRRTEFDVSKNNQILLSQKFTNLAFFICSKHLCILASKLSPILVFRCLDYSTHGMLFFCRQTRTQNTVSSQ